MQFDTGALQTLPAKTGTLARTGSGATVTSKIKAVVAEKLMKGKNIIKRN